MLKFEENFSINTINFPLKHTSTHFCMHFVMFNLLWSGICLDLEFPSWVLGLFYLEFWVFPWVLDFLEFEFFSKCQISKPGLNMFLKMLKQAHRKNQEVKKKWVGYQKGLVTLMDCLKCWVYVQPEKLQSFFLVWWQVLDIPGNVLLLLKNGFWQSAYYIRLPTGLEYLNPWLIRQVVKSLV